MSFHPTFKINYIRMKNDVLKGLKLLIVEDDFSSRLYLNKILEKTGAILINASDGETAVNKVKQDVGIDVVLMDIQLPVMDGYDAAARIREIKKEIIIIAQTAYGLQADKRRINDAGFNDFMIKPIMAQKLIDKIAELASNKK